MLNCYSMFAATLLKLTELLGTSVFSGEHFPSYVSVERKPCSGRPGQAPSSLRASFDASLANC